MGLGIDHPVVQALATVAMLATALAAPVKLIVDAVRFNKPDWPGEAYALLAFALGITFGLLALLAAGQTSVPQVATGVMAGLCAGAMAVGVTEMHKAAQARRDAATDDDDASDDDDPDEGGY